LTHPYSPRNRTFWRAVLGLISLGVSIGLGALILTM